MSENTSSIRDDLREAGRGKEITGHEIMDISRFMEDTRHMIIFDVLKYECPVGDKDERVRIFLTNEGYQTALQSQEHGEMKIIRHARVKRGDLFFDAPEHDNEI
jgi:hypothetical protein